MGNNQSSSTFAFDDKKCCRNCWGSPLLKDDADDEWFGELPRDKKKRKKKSRSQRNLEKLPVVLEVCAMIFLFVVFRFIMYINNFDVFASNMFSPCRIVM